MENRNIPTGLSRSVWESFPMKSTSQCPQYLISPCLSSQRKCREGNVFSLLGNKLGGAHKSVSCSTQKQTREPFWSTTDWSQLKAASTSPKGSTQVVFYAPKAHLCPCLALFLLNGNHSAAVCVPLTHCRGLQLSGQNPFLARGEDHAQDLFPPYSGGLSTTLNRDDSSGRWARRDLTQAI